MELVTGRPVVDPHNRMEQTEDELRDRQKQRMHEHGDQWVEPIETQEM